MNENSSLPSDTASPAPGPSTSAAPAPAPTGGGAQPLWRNPWLIVALLALGLAGWQWLETRLRLADAQQEIARRLAEGDGMNRESRLLAKQAQDQALALQTQIGALEARLAESQNQQTALENLYQDLARSRDEWALAEIEQSVTLAAQQLQLAGNIQGAVLALQAADNRLSGASRPQFIGVRKALLRDLDRLKALPQIDLAGMSVRLESVIAAIDGMPLAVEVRPRETAEAPPESAATATGAAADAAAPPSVPESAWRTLLRDAWRDIRSLVRIQRFDRDEPVLLAPGQDFFLRENLKLRLLNARLALLARDQWTFRNELKAAQSVLERHFDAQAKPVQAAVASLQQLAGAELVIDLPTLNESLSAIRSLKAGRDKNARR